MMTTQEPLEHEIKKSRVRINVTYLMSATYAIAAVTLIVWLMTSSKLDLALGVFSGVASTTATIIAFWFGSRGSAQSQLGDLADDSGGPDDTGDGEDTDDRP